MNIQIALDEQPWNVAVTIKLLCLVPSNVNRYLAAKIIGKGSLVQYTYSARWVTMAIYSEHAQFITKWRTSGNQVLMRWTNIYKMESIYIQCKRYSPGSLELAMEM